MTAGTLTTQSAAKKASAITLKAQTKTYTGKKLAYTGEVTRMAISEKDLVLYVKNLCPYGRAPLRATQAGTKPLASAHKHV